MMTFASLRKFKTTETEHLIRDKISQMIMSMKKRKVSMKMVNYHRVEQMKALAAHVTKNQSYRPYKRTKTAIKRE